eukprot:2689554-Amphidinium_carterae.1
MDHSGLIHMEHTHCQSKVSFGVSIASKISLKHKHHLELENQRLLLRLPVAVEAYPCPFPDRPCHFMVADWASGICLSSPFQGA